ncbi:cytochrome P450 [Serendipita vermifera]|nr:cytochrome P450 [Serendipita vermifera]
MSTVWIDSIAGHLERYASQTGLTTTQLSTSLGFGLLALAGAGAYASSRMSQGNHGPGPKGMPILGNIADLPKDNDPKVYAEWSKKYGDFVYLTVLGQPMYLINSYKIATELLDGRAMIYSDRPSSVMANELVGWKNGPVPISSLSPRFPRYRKLFHMALRKERVRELAPLQERSTSTMLKHFLDKPDDFIKHIRYCVGAVITKLTYDYDLKEDNDPFVELAEKVADNFSQAAAPGVWLVDIFPWLQYIPDWFPGANFKRLAKEWSDTKDVLLSKPYNEVKEQMAAGTHRGSVTSRLLTIRDDEPLTEEEEFRIMNVLAGIYAGGADTTVSAITTLVLAMVLYPDVQRKAQEEIDRVIGTDRLPVMSDRSSLPFIEAVYREVLRWHPIAPLGVPHRLTKQDTWNGYTLPAGSTIITNIWAMGQTYDDSSIFKPERHLNQSNSSDYVDPRDYVFGFGRRICPGRDLADAGVWLATASLLAAFKFEKKSDGKGGFIEPKEEYLPGIISHPKPFECSIKPRLPGTANLINALYTNHQDS